jgi:hypothetical protein
MARTEREHPLGEESGLIRQVFQIAWPAALEALLIGVVDLVDMAMVSSLKLSAVSAVGVTSQPKRILLMFTLALNVAAAAWVSRRIGAGEKREANPDRRKDIHAGAPWSEKPGGMT